MDKNVIYYFKVIYCKHITELEKFKKLKPDVWDQNILQFLVTVAVFI